MSSPRFIINLKPMIFVLNKTISTIIKLNYLSLYLSLLSVATKPPKVDCGSLIASVPIGPPDGLPVPTPTSTSPPPCVLASAPRPLYPLPRAGAQLPKLPPHS